MKNFSKLKIVHYTDDSTVCDIRNKLKTSTSRLNYKLHKVEKSLCANKLAPNDTKKFLIFSKIQMLFTLPLEQVVKRFRWSSNKFSQGFSLRSVKFFRPYKKYLYTIRRTVDFNKKLFSLFAKDFNEICALIFTISSCIICFRSMGKFQPNVTERTLKIIKRMFQYR